MIQSFSAKYGYLNTEVSTSLCPFLHGFLCFEYDPLDMAFRHLHTVTVASKKVKYLRNKFKPGGKRLILQKTTKYY